VSVSLSPQRRGSLTLFAHAHLALTLALCVSIAGAAGVLFAQAISPDNAVAVIESVSDDYRTIGYGAPVHKHRSLQITPTCNVGSAACNTYQMVPQMNVEAGLIYAVQIVDTIEGTALVAYLDTLANPHVWTIGHGTTRVNGQPVHQGMRCTQEECDRWSMEDMRSDALYVVAHTNVALTDWQLGALTSFTYNEGSGTYFDSSVREALNRGLYAVAANRLLEYDMAGGKRLRGLDTRRGRERAMFLGLGAKIFTTFIAPVVPTGVSAASATPSEADRLNQEQIDKYT
jgi:lysozyme